MACGFVVGRLGKVVQFYRERFRLKIRRQIDFGVEYPHQRGLGVVGSPQLFAHDEYQAGFRAIGDHLDRADEMLSLREQPGEAFLARADL